MAEVLGLGFEEEVGKLKEVAAIATSGQENGGHNGYWDRCLGVL